jgi:GTP-binding protein Era
VVNKVEEFRSGYVTIVGRPNVGKSTLTNRIIGEKITIISDKPQTTRYSINAIYNDDESQIIFVDTPGIHKPKNKLGEFMLTKATETIRDVDIVVMLVDDYDDIGPGDKFILDAISKANVPVILVLNKIDTTTPEKYKRIYDMYSEFECIDEIINMSALKGINVDLLMKMIKDRLPMGPKYYPDDMITDQPERAIVSEIVREKVLEYLRDEIPHGVVVEIDKMKYRDGKKKIVDISATIICEKKSHKGIIIGKGGRKLKGIGKAAREDIEKFLDYKVFLELWVKVRPGWRDNDSQLKNYGFK